MANEYMENIIEESGICVNPVRVAPRFTSSSNCATASMKHFPSSSDMKKCFYPGFQGRLFE